MKLEYLVLIPNHDSFCNSKSAFFDFLKVDSLISINDQKISYRRSGHKKNLLTANIRVETDLIPSKNERYFLVVVECKDLTDTQLLFELGEKLKSIIIRINPVSTVINTIWDDVGRHYAELAYPLINEVENLMRKLISKFMLINVGVNWSKEGVHPDIFKKIESYSDEELYSNDLYKLDFIHLSDVLFKKKRDITLERLDRILSKTQFSEDDKKDILKYIPRSNWEKHFTSILNSDASKLEENWNRLYKLRNKVAHNRFITKDDFSEINGICIKIKKLLIEALDKLGEVDLDTEERESIVLSYQPRSPAAIGYLAEKSVAEFFIKNGYDVIQEMDFDKNYLDFLIVKDTESIGVNVKSISGRNLHHYLRMFSNNSTFQVISINELDFEKYSKFKFVFVLRDFELIKPRSIERLQRILQQSNNNVEFIFGIVNDQDEFQIIKL